jgi:hypothetical protein
MVGKEVKGEETLEFGVWRGMFRSSLVLRDALQRRLDPPVSRSQKFTHYPLFKGSRGDFPRRFAIVRNSCLSHRKSPIQNLKFKI